MCQAILFCEVKQATLRLGFNELRAFSAELHRSMSLAIDHIWISNNGLQSDQHG